MQGLAAEHSLEDVNPLQVKTDRLIEQADDGREASLGRLPQLGGRGPDRPPQPSAWIEPAKASDAGLHLACQRRVFRRTVQFLDLDEAPIRLKLDGVVGAR
jgi:hypothetical protein